LFYDAIARLRKTSFEQYIFRWMALPESTEKTLTGVPAALLLSTQITDFQ